MLVAIHDVLRKQSDELRWSVRILKHFRGPRRNRFERKARKVPLGSPLSRAAARSLLAARKASERRKGFQVVTRSILDGSRVTAPIT